MMVVAWYSADNIDKTLDCCQVETEHEALMKLLSEARKLQDARILVTAIGHVARDEIDEAYQCLDTWCEELSADKVFDFKVRN